MERTRIFFDPSAKPSLRTVVSRSDAFEVVTDPGLADFCLFGIDEPDYVRKSDAFINYPDRCISVLERDDPTYFLPACYPSNYKTWLGRRRSVTIPYLLSAVSDPNPFIEDFSAQQDRPYLYSFRGAATSWLRKRMFKTLNTQSDTIIQDSSDYRHWDFNPSYIPTKSSPQRDYADIIAKSSFVLCPKGAGASSIRLFETMQASRVPVIIADNWVPLPDVNFNDFAIVIPERNVYETDKIIRARAGEFEKLASEARRTWERICMPGRDAETLLRALIHLRQIRNPGREKFIHAIFPLIELQRLTFVTLRKWARALVLKLLSAARVKFPYAMNR